MGPVVPLHASTLQQAPGSGVAAAPGPSTLGAPTRDPRVIRFIASRARRRPQPGCLSACRFEASGCGRRTDVLAIAPSPS